MGDTREWGALQGYGDVLLVQKETGLWDIGSEPTLTLYHRVGRKAILAPVPLGSKLAVQNGQAVAPHYEFDSVHRRSAIAAVLFWRDPRSPDLYIIDVTKRLSGFAPITSSFARQNGMVTIDTNGFKLISICFLPSERFLTQSWPGLF